MKVINLDQKSQAWLDWRNKGITATESGVIKGRSPYKTRWRLWAEKTGKVPREAFTGNPNVKRGEGNEYLAREYYESKHDELLLPVCAESDSRPLFRASLDGITSDNRPVELKAPHPTTMAAIIADGEQSVPYKVYWHQVQHQMFVVDAQEGTLCFYLKNEDTGEVTWREFTIKRDQDYLDSMIAECEAFWELIQNKTPPPKDPERDEFVPEELNDIRKWREAADQWLTANAQVQQLKDQIKEIEAGMKDRQKTMIELMGGFVHANAFGVKITRYQVKGKIDWDRVRKDLISESDEVLETYRKSGRQQVRVAPSTEETKRSSRASTKAAIAEAKDIPPDEREGDFAW